MWIILPPSLRWLLANFAEIHELQQLCFHIKSAFLIKSSELAEPPAQPPNHDKSFVIQYLCKVNMKFSKVHFMILKILTATLPAMFRTESSFWVPRCFFTPSVTAASWVTQSSLGFTVTLTSASSLAARSIEQTHHPI